ncbi:MAG: hypothetical protein WAT23_01570 [Chromatiaceae bacterium]
MSNLIKLLHDMASLRTEYQRLHQDLLGLSVRRLLFLARPGARQGVDARFQHLFQRQKELQAEMDQLTADDLAIRRGEELFQALTNFHQAFGETLKQLELLHQAQASQAAGGPGNSSHRLLAPYDDALQHQRRLGARINDLLADL